MNQVFSIPNIISVVRLLLIPGIAVTYLMGYYPAAGILLVLSGLSDMVDGYIARHFHMITSVGKILDPLADKLTMVVVVFCLMLRHPQVALVLGVMVVKEGLMLLGSVFLFKKGKRPCASKIWGKLATAFLYLVILTVVVSDCVNVIWGVQMPSGVIWTLSGFAAAAMMMALLQYYPIFKAILNGRYDMQAEKMETTGQQKRPGGRSSAV